MAFDEPGLFNRKVFFTITSHGYEVDKDGFGYRGKALEVTEGGSADIVIRRLNIARRLYRVTGAGIYRDSVLTGDAVPIREPLLNGKVFGPGQRGQRGLPGKDPLVLGRHQPARLSARQLPRAGRHLRAARPGGTRARGRRRPELLPRRPRVRPADRPDARRGPDLDLGTGRPQGSRRHASGCSRSTPRSARCSRSTSAGSPSSIRKHSGSRRSPSFPKPPHTAGEFPDGHPFLHQDQGVEYIYYATPYPLVRVPADPEQLKNVASCEAFTCLQAGHPAVATAVRPRCRTATLRYGWKTNTQLLRQDQQTKLIVSRRIKPDEALLNLRDIDSGKVVVAHGGSVYWNAYRRRWVMITVESYGSTSFLGEIWYAEADTPLGPWVYARKIVTHDKYSFYNPKQHPMFDKDGGRIIFFEGTYTTTFSGNPDPTPRYDYNQVMYQLDLSDPRLALPVAIYEVPSGPGGSTRLVTKTRRRSTEDRRRRGPSRSSPPTGRGSRRAGVRAIRRRARAILAHPGQRPAHRPGPAPGRCFSSFPPTSRTTPRRRSRFYEYREEGGGRRFYSVDAPNARTHARAGRASCSAASGETRRRSRLW